MTEPEKPPAGKLALELVEDIKAFAAEVGMYRTAYARLTGAIDELKVRKPYLKLEADLVKLLERKARE